MNDFSLIDKIKILMDTIVTSPFFLACLFVILFLLMFFILCFFLKKKVNKWVPIISWILLAIVLVVTHRSFFLDLIDNLFDNVFMAIYFPNLSVYIIILMISNGFFVYSLFSKRIKKQHKFLNITQCFIIDMLLILIIDTISKNNINIYDELTVYSNSTLLVLLELTTAIFISWILLNLLITAHFKLKKYDEIEYPEMPEIIFDEI